MTTTLISKQIKENGRFSGLFPGWGETRVIACKTNKDHYHSIVADTDKSYHPPNNINLNEESHGEKLNLLYSLSIGGNDLLGSSLYTAGIVAAYAGKIAPLSLCLVTFVLFFYRNVFAEIVTAIPVNGGNYNAVLNVSSKKSAAVVSCLSILSYVATAIISAFSSVLYIKLLWDGIDIRLGTIVILILFAIITLFGVGESAGVSLFIFVFHLLTLILLILWGLAYGIQDNFQIFHDNLNTDFPTIETSTGSILGENNLVLSLFCGFCLGMLGITGVETPANYVEEMKDSSVLLGVINWMWILVGTINPCISLVSMMVMPLDFIYDHQGNLLARMAGIMGGNAAKIVVVIDAIIVLCGGVLAAYVGVSSLLKTLAEDSILPGFLKVVNRRGAAYMAIITFCAFSVILFLLVFSPHNPTSIGPFGVVFAIAFLCVLISFLYANFLLKLYRQNLGRLVIAEWWEVYFCAACLIAALLGNLILNPDVFTLFIIYLCGCLAVVILMFMRVNIYSYFIWALRNVEINFEKLKELSAHARSIRKAAKKRENYSEDNCFIDDEATEILHEDDEEENVPIRVAARHTVADVMEVIKSKDKGIIDVLKGNSHHHPHPPQNIHDNLDLPHPYPAPLTSQNNNNNNNNNSKRRLPLDSSGIELPAIDPSNLAKFNEFLAKKDPQNLNKDDIESLKPLSSVGDQEDDEEEEFYDTNPNDIIPPIMYNWIGNIVENLYVTSESENQDENIETTSPSRIRAGTLDNLDLMMSTHQIKFKLLEFFMESLENIIGSPIVYLCRGLDPIALNLALDYVASNELTNNIIVVHIVDDKQVVKSHTKILNRLKDLGMDSGVLEKYHSKLVMQHITGTFKEKSNDNQKKKTALSVADVFAVDYNVESILSNLSEEIQSLPVLVSLFDTLHMSKKISCLIVRGTTFCPSAIKWVSDYLQIPLTNFIMGMPGLDFPFPISRLNGVRIAIPETDNGLRLSARKRLENVLKKVKDKSDAAHNLSEIIHDAQMRPQSLKINKVEPITTPSNKKAIQHK